MYYTEGYIKEIRFEGDGNSCGRETGKARIILDPVEPYKIILDDKEFALYVDSGDGWEASGDKSTRISAQLRCQNVEYVVGTVLGCERVTSLVSLKLSHAKVRIYVEEGSMVLRLAVK